mmetsp:Transcript_45147/g.88849  ORF Transcript_45147/g.88849 Transcript_45147/m.88849 type:complete len:236 (+) Transcript_45147:1266-1973(+)
MSIETGCRPRFLLLLLLLLPLPEEVSADEGLLHLLGRRRRRPFLSPLSQLSPTSTPTMLTYSPGPCSLQANPLSPLPTRPPPTPTLSTGTPNLGLQRALQLTRKLRLTGTPPTPKPAPAPLLLEPATVLPRRRALGPLLRFLCCYCYFCCVWRLSRDRDAPHGFLSRAPLPRSPRRRKTPRTCTRKSMTWHHGQHRRRHSLLLLNQHHRQYHRHRQYHHHHRQQQQQQRWAQLGR